MVSQMHGSNKKAISVFAIIVLYQTRPEDSTSLSSLVEASKLIDPARLELSILIADNTPEWREFQELPGNPRYKRFTDNPGLAVPYNLAISEAERDGFEWLLTLDQDTTLPPDFFALMIKHLELHGKDESVAAVVPRVTDNGVPISPFRFVGGFLPVITGRQIDGVLGPHASAINSASLLRTRALADVGGYDDRFPLNNSDTALFDRLDRSGYKVAIAGDVVVGHELAIMQREHRMSAARYRQLLRDEGDFWDLHMSVLGRAERLLRLMGRAAKQVSSGEDREFLAVTLREVGLRLLTRRSVRIHRGNPVATDSVNLLDCFTGSRRQGEK
jgi:GT2 family glycosyltransferase